MIAFYRYLNSFDDENRKSVGNSFCYSVLNSSYLNMHCLFYRFDYMIDCCRRFQLGCNNGLYKTF